MKERSSSKNSPKRTAKRDEPITIGMDLGDRKCCYCVFDNQGQILRGPGRNKQRSQSRKYSSRWLCPNCH
jgi:hypothetical protein